MEYTGDAFSYITVNKDGGRQTFRGNFKTVSKVKNMENWYNLKAIFPKQVNFVKIQAFTAAKGRVLGEIDVRE